MGSWHDKGGPTNGHGENSDLPRWPVQKRGNTDNGKTGGGKKGKERKGYGEKSLGSNVLRRRILRETWETPLTGERSTLWTAREMEKARGIQEGFRFHTTGEYVPLWRSPRENEQTQRPRSEGIPGTKEDELGINFL